jgi:hypothetical protein
MPKRSRSGRTRKIEIRKAKEKKETRILQNFLKLTIISCFMRNGNLLDPRLQIDGCVGTIDIRLMVLLSAIKYRSSEFKLGENGLVL